MALNKNVFSLKGKQIQIPINNNAELVSAVIISEPIAMHNSTFPVGVVICLINNDILIVDITKCKLANNILTLI